MHKFIDLTNIPPLRYTEVVVYNVNYGELERYINKITGKTLEIPQILECSNYTCHNFDVSPTQACIYGKEKIEAFLFGDAKNIPTYTLGTLLNVMCEHKMLKPGNYIISVSW